MATTTRGKGFPDFLGSRDAEDIRQQFIAEPLAAARQPAFGTALAALQFLTALPEAVVAARQRELERVSASGRENDPRLPALEASIEYAGRARTAANLAHTRAQRLLSMVTKDAVQFHGFVSTRSLEPLPGLTVRLVDRAGERRGAGRSATTAEDGYFSFQRDGNGEEARPAPDHQDGSDTGGRAVTVEIADPSGTVVYHDPVELTFDGVAYREYLIEKP